MRRFIATLLFTVAMMGVSAQTANDPVAFEINGKQIHKSQFMKEFLKSIGQDPAAAPTACTYEKRKALEDYVQLYVNFQVKLEDAYSMGLDTSSALCEELAVYRKELAAPFLIDSATMQSLLKEAYERNHYALHAAHILVPCRESASPEDTLKAYNHAMELYNRALKEDFYKVAQQEMHDQRINDMDPMMREKANEVNPYEGDLGCFTVFDMVYPFESAAYSMNPGDIHTPVRSRYGYHVLKLFDRFEFYGKVQLAHIWVSDKDANARGRVNAAYKLLKEGSDFGLVAKNNSDDNTTNKTGGIMPELACNQLPVEYVEAVARGLKVGEFTAPIKSRYGWHIIKLLKKDTMPDFESMIPYYKSRMTRGERSVKPQNIFIEQCKEKYDFIDYTKTKASKKKNAPYMASLAQVRSLVTDSILYGNFHYDSNQITDMRPLFKVGDRQYNSRNFARYLRKNKKLDRLSDLDVYLNNRYEEYINGLVLQYADDRLEQDNAEFAELINEYRHGLMIFSYNDKAVWSRSINDTAGFRAFYDSVSPMRSYDDTNDAVYFWNHRARVAVLTVADSACLSPSKAEKLVRKGVEKGWSLTAIQEALMNKVNKKKCTVEGDPVTAQLELVEVGNQSLLTQNEWSKGIYVHPTEKGYKFLVVEKILQPELKSLEEARGFYLDAYQNYLEEQNNIALRKKYKVKINQSVIDEITY